MRKIVTILLAVATLTACARQGGRTEKSTQRTVMSGAYSEQRPLKENEMELFRQVTADMDGVKYTPQSVATQVVAGLNYRFICKAETVTRSPQTYQAQVTVYKPLPGQGEARITDIKKL